MWRARQKKCHQLREGGIRKWNVESTTDGPRSTKTDAKRLLNNLLNYPDKSEVQEVNAGELEFQVLAPNEPNIDIEHIVVQARGEGHQRQFQAFCRQRANETRVASVARWEERQRMLTVVILAQALKVRGLFISFTAIDEATIVQAIMHGLASGRATR